MQSNLELAIDDEVLSYHVYNSTEHCWLNDSLQSPRFTQDYSHAGNFDTFEAADKAMQAAQRKWPDDVLYVMACMPTRS